MSVTLRKARPTDAGATGDILWRFFDDTSWMPTPYSGAETASFCGTMIDRGWMTVAENDAGVLGFLARDGAEIHALYLARGVCGQGVGQSLMDHAKTASHKLQLWTYAANSRALTFYQRQGFVETGRSDGAHRDENLPDIVYLWTKESVT